MKFNKVLAAAAIAIPLQFAHAQEPAINAQLAAIDVDGYDPGIALMVSYEHPAEFIFNNVSIEGEVTASVIDPSDDYAIYTDELSFYTAGLYLKYTHPMTQQLSLYGRAGVHYESVTYTTNNFNFGRFSGTDNSLGRNIGIGIDYQVAPAIDLTIGATALDSDSDFTDNIRLISVGAKFQL